MARRQNLRLRIVSLTPTALARDSRTLKSAKAYARFGFDSVVIEGIASRPRFEDSDLTVYSVARRSPATALPVGRKLIRGRRAGFVAAGVFCAFLCFFVITYFVRPLGKMRKGALYHLHSYEYFPLVWFWCRLFGGCYIYDAHDFYSGIRTEPEMSPAQRHWIGPFQLWLERKCVAGAAAFLTVNDGTAALMEQEFGRRPTIVRNCHDFRLDRRPAQTLREVAGLNSDDFLVVCPGQWKPGHSTLETIKALSCLPDRIHLAFVGTGYEWCREFAARDKVAARIHLVGAVAANEVVPFISSADAALVYYDRHNPNYLHALPNGFFQSLAAGLPLLYADLPGMTAAAACHGFGTPVAPRSAPDVALALRRLEADPAEQYRLREVAKAFSAEINFQNEEEILRAILADLGLSGADPAEIPTPLISKASTDRGDG